MKVKVFKLCHIYDSYGEDQIDLTPVSIDWEEYEGSLEEFREVVKQANNMQAKKKSDFRFVFLVDEDDILNEVFKTATEWGDHIKALREKEQKAEEKRKKEREQKAIERKKKQLEKLKKEFEDK